MTNAVSERLDVRYVKILKFLISGASSALVNFSLLYVLTDLFGIYYLFSSVVSFVFGAVIGFVMQKFWTFNDDSRDSLKKQVWMYSLLAVANVGLNTFFVYILVEKVSFHYLFAQFTSNLFLAVESFIIYKKVIFKRTIV